MAIIIEEEKNKIGIVKFLMWFLILIIIGVAGYYIFFAQPQLIEIVTPSNFKAIDPLAGINLNPEEVLNSQDFLSLKKYVTPPEPGNTGKTNPFAP